MAWLVASIVASAIGLGSGLWFYLKSGTARGTAGEAETAYRAGLDALKRGNPENAFESLDKARRLGYDSALLERAGGLLMASGGRDDEAEPMLRRAWLTSKDPDPEVADNLSRILIQRFQLDLAVEVLDRWATQSPDDPKPWLKRAEVEVKKGSIPAVVASFYAQALKRDPRSDRARLGLAEALHQEGKEPEAAKEYAASVDQNPQEPDPAALIGLGRALQATGDENGALSLLERAALIRPDDPEITRLLAAIALRRGQPEKALAMIDKVLPAAKQDHEIHYLRSMVLARMGRTAESKAEQKETLRLRKELDEYSDLQTRLGKSPKDFDIMVKLARWLVDHGRGEEAADWARMALAGQPSNKEAVRVLADYHQARGDAGLANFYRERAKP